MYYVHIRIRFEPRSVRGAIQLPRSVVCTYGFTGRRGKYCVLNYYIVKYTARCLSKKRLRKRIITCPVGGRMLGL